MKSDEYCPRLIEVALPIREISAESVRDKNIHHAHISHLHIWWARRPLATSRAVVFASLVPDPDDPNCPNEFRKAVEQHLKINVPYQLQHYNRGKDVYPDKDPYRPYNDLADTLRNRLLTFIAKWSPEAILFNEGRRGTKPSPKMMLDDRSLVKWETCDPQNPQGKEVLRLARSLVKIANHGKIPTVLDSYAGGGAIPLEAGRLGCQAIAIEYNPVAYMILRATCEFPQKYGKSEKRKVFTEEFGKEIEKEIEVPNILVHDVKKWAKYVLEKANTKLAHFYPAGKDDKTVVSYIWVRTAPCSNPSCKGEIPLLSSLLLCSKNDKEIALTMDVDKSQKKISFNIQKGGKINRTHGTMQNRGNVLCPFCEQVTPTSDLRIAGLEGLLGEKMVIVVVEGKDGKEYRVIENSDLNAFRKTSEMDIERPGELILPEINARYEHSNISNSTGIRVHLYGMKTWGSLFNSRQLFAMQTFVKCLHETVEEMKDGIDDEEYRKALVIYLGLWLDRIASFTTNVCRWASGSEIIKTPFSGQAIPMIWDYPEVNPLADSSGTASTQLEYILKIIDHEKINQSIEFYEPLLVRGNAAHIPLNAGISDCLVTDPPYADAISYADLSDFFYVWLKRSIGPLFPEIFSTPLSPKSEEVTSLKHRHNGSGERAQIHYRNLLRDSFIEAMRLVRDPKLLTVMFAHQSTDAWTALISSLFEAGLSPDATWPIATEMPKTALALGTASLETSVTVVCRPRKVGHAAIYKDVRREIEKVVQESVKRFWEYGFRGADLIVACYGPAVGVFGKYERVEKADGTLVEIPELLELARKAARDAIAGEFKGDNLSTLYYVWANLYGVAEQAWDDARMVVQIGGEAENAMEMAKGHGIFIVDGAKCRLALLADRAERRGLGADLNPPFIDALHRSMLLWKQEKRSDLIAYLTERGLVEDGPFWKLAQALFEVLPRDTEDWKLTNTLLGERETLRREGRGLDDRWFNKTDA